MKPVPKIILLITLGWLFLYLIGSFVAATFNVSNWSETERQAIGLSASVIVAFVFGVTRDFWQEL